MREDLPFVSFKNHLNPQAEMAWQGEQAALSWMSHTTLYLKPFVPGSSPEAVIGAEIKMTFFGGTSC